MSDPSLMLPVPSPSPVPANGMVLTKLAALPGKTILDETALADILKVKKRTIRRMVSRYELPPPIPFAGRSAWMAEQVIQWFETRAEQAAKDAARRAAACQKHISVL